jgi:hypothetical protein
MAPRAAAWGAHAVHRRHDRHGFSVARGTGRSIAWYLFVPHGENERLIARAGFTLLSSEDVTVAAEVIAQRWHSARVQYRDELMAREGETNFAGLQRFLACVHRLSAERRLSRYCYLAEKAA